MHNRKNINSLIDEEMATALREYVRVDEPLHDHHFHSPHQDTCMGHFVQFYRSDKVLAAALAEYVRTGIQNGEGVVILATPIHHHLLQNELQMVLPDYPRLILDEQLVLFDADTVLAQVLDNDRPDFEKFNATVGSVFHKIVNTYKNVRCYSELVNILCENRRPECALKIEGFWNQVLRNTPQVTLMCGYATKNLRNERENNEFIPVSHAHSHAIHPEHFTENKTDFFKENISLKVRSALSNISEQRRRVF